MTGLVTAALLATLVAFVISAAEAAFSRMSRTRAHELLEEGRPGSKALVKVVGDTAVTMSRTRQEATIDGNDWSATLHVTDVWVRRDGAWQVIGRHGSPLVGRSASQSAAPPERLFFDVSLTSPA